MDKQTPRILAVDDSASQVKLITKILGGKCGYEVVTADSGHAAWDYLTGSGLTSEGKVDLVITDHDMPNGNGSELVERIRADDRFEGLPVLMASGKPENRDTPGLNDFLYKPYGLRVLIDTVKKYFPD